MIVTEGGKNIYPEDIETAFDGLPVKEYCMFAANYLWPRKELGGEMLVLVLRLEQNQEFTDLLQENGAATGSCRISSASADICSGTKIFPAPPR